MMVVVVSRWLRRWHGGVVVRGSCECFRRRDVFGGGDGENGEGEE